MYIPQREIHLTGIWIPLIYQILHNDFGTPQCNYFIMEIDKYDWIN